MLKIPTYLLLFIGMMSFAQDSPKKIFKFDLTPHAFLNSGIAQLDYNSEYLDVNHRVKFAPALDMSYTRQYGKWCFGAGINASYLQSELLINWRKAGRLNELLDGIYTLNQLRTGIHLLASYKVDSWDFGVKLKITGSIQENRDSTFYLYGEGVTNYQNQVPVSTTRVDTDFSWYDPILREGQIELEAFYTVTKHLGLGLNLRLWSPFASKEPPFFKLVMTGKKYTDQQLVEKFDIANLSMRSPSFQLGCSIRYLLF